jgi:hypothetical protein
MALTAISENSTTTDGTEQTLVTDTTNRVYVFAVDTGAMANGDAVEVRIYTIIRSGGTERLAYGPVAYVNAQGQPQKYSVPVPADISIKVTLKRTAGTDRSYPWKLLAL